MYPSKSDIISTITTAVNNSTSTTGPLSESERADAYDAILAALKTLDPVKGTPTVKY